MLSQNDIINIKKMSFKELKNELKNSENYPVKNLIIRKIMKQKYLNHKYKQNNKTTEEITKNENFSNKQYQDVEDIYKKEIQKDDINNNLLERLNSDIYIRKFAKPSKKDFIPPFANGSGDNFAPFDDKNNFLDLVKDFSNKKFL
ncbi:Hypothetical protein KVN_LOCUS512 [uncultured virus]|nr:Hypothetical protein KVN_LOCUS512 [uncultured virus]